MNDKGFPKHFKLEAEGIQDVGRTSLPWKAFLEDGRNQ